MREAGPSAVGEDDLSLASALGRDLEVLVAAAVARADDVARRFDIPAQDMQSVVNQTSVMSNAGEAESRGVEWAVELRPWQGFTVDSIGAYTDAVLTESTATRTEVDLLKGRPGDPLPYVSKWTALIGVNYEWPLSATAMAFAGANWSYIDRRRTDFGSKLGRQLTLPGYDTADVRVGIDFERWSVSFYGKNITDARGISSLSESNSRQSGGVYDPNAFTWAFGSTFLVIRPRTFGLMLSARF